MQLTTSFPYFELFQYFESLLKKREREEKKKRKEKEKEKKKKRKEKKRKMIAWIASCLKNRSEMVDVAPDLEASPKVVTF